MYLFANPMRLPPQSPPAPQAYDLDVLIAQNCGLPATGWTVRTQPTGGSEWQVVVLAEALAARGYRVGVVSPVLFFQRSHGVDYMPIGEVVGRREPIGGLSEVRRPSARVRAEVMISERFAPLVPFVEFGRVVFDLHDLPDPRAEVVIQLMQQIPDSKVVVHSEFMRSLLPGWPRVEVIPCMLPDEFYEGPGSPIGSGSDSESRELGVRIPHRAHPRYVYGSAAMKGLEPTLALWRELKKKRVQHFRKAELVVTSPGYDQINPAWLKDQKDVTVKTGLSPAGIQSLLADSDGIFMASTYPETFGIVFAQCEAAGRPARVLRVHGQVDALDATMATPDVVFTNADDYVASFERDYAPVSPNDFRVSSHIDRWIDVLGLKPKATREAT